MLRAMRKAAVLCLSIFLQASLYAQNNCKCNEADALRMQIGKYFNSGKLDSAEIILSQLKSSPNKTCQIIYLDGVGQVNVAKKLFAEARVLFAIEEKLQKELNCKKLIIRFYNTMARYYQEAGYRDSMSMITLKALELAEEEKDWYAAARACTNLASVFQQEQQFDKSFFYNKKGLPLARLSKDTLIIAALLNRTGTNYLEKFEQTKEKRWLDSARLLLKESVLISIGRPSNLIELPDAYNKLSTSYLFEHEYAKALRHADTAIAICPPGVFDFYRHILNAYKNKSKASKELKDIMGARTMADSALRYADMFNAQLTIEPLQTIFETSKTLGDYKRASEAHELMTKTKDSLFTLEKTSAINELEKKYNQAKNEKTIRELSLQKQIYLLLAAALLLGIVAIAFFLRQQSLKHKQTILETEQRLNRARMNPHFFFNALASLQSFALEKNDGKAIAGNLSKFSHIMRETLESTYNDYVTVEEETSFLTEYLDLQQIRFPEKFNYSITADENVETDELLVPSMIVQPFVENSIEHGFAGIAYKGSIAVRFSKKEKELHISITDDGKGFTKDSAEKNSHISRAGQIVKDRIYLLNLKLKTKASFTIDDGKEKGVVVKILLPEMYKS
jgi:two-component sensor histidine kinase